MKRILCSLLSSAVCGAALAVPAKPAPVTLRQPDGSTIEARIIGDEFYHTYLTADGYPLVYNNGRYEYAVIKNGILVSSEIAAVNIGSRPEGHTRLLSEISLKDVASLHDASYIEAKKEMAARRDNSSVRRNTKIFNDNPQRYLSTNFPNKGKQKGLVILVEYQDVRFSLEDPHDYFSRLLNEPGFSDCNGTGSAREYFIESSHGQFDPDFDVYGPVTLPENQAYYGSNTGGFNDAYAWKMVTTSAEYLDDEIDFTQYDRDGDGYVDNIYVFYAGEGESGGGGYETVWPHSSQISAFDKKNQYVHDGVIINRYACSNEMDYDVPDGIGTFCHEFSHVMGLPDFYATGYQASFTPGPFSLMDSGSYNNNSRTPPLYSAFERYCAGWLDLEVIDGKTNMVMPPIGTNKGYVIETGNPDEFYVLENRQRVSWDKYMPGHGLLVWHIDFDEKAWRDNAVNNDPYLQRLDIVEADDMRDTDSYEGDTFPGANGVTAFTDDTTPSMKSRDGKRLSLPITEIEESADGFITFKVAGGMKDAAAPAAPAVAGVSAYGAVISWMPVEGARDYQVSVMSYPDFFIANDYFCSSTAGEISLTVTGLNPETKYVCYVQAVGEECAGTPSPVVFFSTSAIGFSDMKVLASDAEDVTESGFTAVWQPLDGATDYLLSVFECKEGDPIAETVDFTGGAGDMPEGWNSTSRTLYNMASYAGKAVPSLRLTETGGKIETSVYADGISGVSFWHRGNGAATADNKIIVEGRTGDEWKELAVLAVITAAGGHVEALDFASSSVEALRISYAGDAKGSLAIDDIEIFHGHSISAEILPAFDSLSVGSGNSYTVAGLKELTRYCYSVKAVNAEAAVSGDSNRIFVTTTESAAVGEVEVSGKEDVNVFDLTGRIVVSGKFSSVCRGLRPGIYIVKGKNQTNKIIINK